MTPSKQQPANDTTTVPALAIARAKQRNIDTSRAAKDVRGRLRANFDKLVASRPDLYGPNGTVKAHANDGNRWGAIPADVADVIFKPRNS